MVLFPFLASVVGAGGTIVDKIILRKKNMNPQLYQVVGFSGLFLVMLPFIYFFWGMDSKALLIPHLLILSLVIVFSVVANILNFYSLKGEDVGNLVSARALSPLFIIFFSIVFSFFIDEGLFQREAGVIIPSIIAATAIVVSHVERHHLSFNKFYIISVIAGIFGALELTISRIILDFYSPLTFYFIRVSFVLVISFLLFRPNLGLLDKGSAYLIIGASGLWVLYRVILYSGYTSIGIISTTLIIMLSPTFLYIFTYIFLKEKIALKHIIATVVVVACIGYVLMF